jgi:endonuclease/exonuclease/phosphatase family metal-dependent hydrolase
MGIRTNKLQQILSYLEENNFDILLAQEANVDFKHKTTQTYIKRMLKKKYHITVSEKPFRATTTTMPGGTFVITSTPIKSRTINKISDEAGRWAGNILILKNNQKIALISTYQTIRYQSSGPISINAQQTAWLASNNCLINPIIGYQKDLLTLLNNLKKEEIPFILAGDFNEHDEDGGTLKFLLDYGVKKLEINNVTESQKRGRHQIDHIFISKDLVSQIKHVQLLDYPSIYDTDHWPMQLILDLRDCIPDILQHTFGYIRRIRSSNIKLVRKYVEHRIKLYKQYRIKEKIQDMNKALSDLRDGDNRALRGFRNQFRNWTIKTQQYV